MTRFEQFKEGAQSNIVAYRTQLMSEGVWDFKETTKLLQEFQNKFNYRLMNYLFGEQLGGHLWDEFKHQHGSCVLRWFNRLNEEFYIYVLHEIKTNRTLYANC